MHHTARIARHRTHGAAADEIRARRHPDNVVTYIIDRNINYTNVCNVVCTFCAFYRRPGAPDTYVRTSNEICEKIDETIALGGTGVLMQGGLHPDFGIEWYEDLLRTLHAEVSGVSAALLLAARDSQHPSDLKARLRDDHGALQRRRTLQPARRRRRDSRRRSAQACRDKVHDR